VESVEELEGEWERLEATMSPRLPFARPLWTMLWMKHFAQTRRAARDELLLLALSDEAGVVRGIAPLVLTERPGFGPVRTRMLRTLGADPNITELGSIITAPEDEPAVLEALLDWLEARDETWDLLFLNGLTESVGQMVHRRRGAQWGAEKPDFLLELPGSWDALRARLGRNVKESLRKCYNSLKRDGHSFEFRVRSTPDEVAAGVEVFFQLHSARAALEDTVGHSDVFALERSRAFLREYMREAAALGEARVFELVVAGDVVATRLGFVLGDELYLYFSGFEPDWRQYSVMTTTVSETLRWAIDQRLRVVNLSPGRDVSKTRWGPTEVAFREVYLPSRSRRGGLVHKAYVQMRDESSRLSRVLRFARRAR
jgi:CelD/BcsL family acetyltransferase involved in cellulose biosynthesis